MAEIKLRYRSCDGCNILRTYKSLKGAQKYAIERVGAHPDIGHGYGRGYAVSSDGIGTITIVEGCTYDELFPAPTAPAAWSDRIATGLEPEDDY